MFTVNINIRNTNNIINHINSIKQNRNRKQGICVLIGAGADISSGGVLFRDLKLRFLEENSFIIPSNISDKVLDKQFEDQIDRMSQNSRCETLDKIMRRYKTPSEGYSLLVMLAEVGYIDAVITTNFDYLLEETQKMLNLNPFTIFTPGRAVPEEYYMRRNNIPPVYLKMHGDLSDRLITHLTQSEIQSNKYGDKFVKLFAYIIQNYSLIIVGYGGYDHLITEIIKQEINNLDEVYWCNICEPKEDSDLAKVLEKENKLYFVNTSFDSLFQNLAKFLLRDITLKNTNPIFLPTVIQSKIDNQVSMFNEKFEYREKIVQRKKGQDLLESFLSSFDNKCVAIIGEYKFGKSCFIYKAMQELRDIIFFPIVCDCKHTILESMSQAIGYDTDMPFPIMYSFFKWWDKTNKQLVFIIDDFFNIDCINETSDNQIIDFLNLLYIVREFKCIQFILSFQNSIYDKLEKNKTFSSFGNIITEKIYINEFSEEVEELLTQNSVNNSDIPILKKQELFYTPYVWEILNRNNIVLTQNLDFFAQYTDALYNISTRKFNFTKHAFNSILQKLAYNQIFESNIYINSTSEEYSFLKEKGIIGEKDNIVYSELAIYFCRLYILKLKTWEHAIPEIITSISQKGDLLTEQQMDVYVSILAETNEINKFDIVFKNIDNVLVDKNYSFSLKKFVIKVLRKCAKYNQKLFENYMKCIDINIYSLELQYYLFKVCAELCPKNLVIWINTSKDKKLSYAAFVLLNDNLYNLLKNTQLHDEIVTQFKDENSVIKLWHLLTYWGWDNVNNAEYLKLKGVIVNKVFPIINRDNTAIQYTVLALMRYAYNVFFNAGEDFEEQFIRCRNMPINALVKTVLNGKVLTKDQYIELLKINTDINNSWLFIVSNIIVIQSMKNSPGETYNMLYSFWDNINFDVQVQHLDFFLSSVFWSLYLCMPCDRKRFVVIFEKLVEKYERILFMLPIIERISTLHKFSEEFDQIFEDGFNPMAFYFYTAPYESLTTDANWDNGKSDLYIYWNLAECMSNLGKYDDILRIVHALGQMISIYPKEGYDALENLTGFEQPIIKKGIIRIFKENYLRYSNITNEALERSVYNFSSNDIDEIIYNSDFLLENRTMEQLHWGRLFYNLEQLTNINIAETFLLKILNSSSCSGFLYDFIKSLC